MTVQMAPVNAVTGLTVTAPELSADGLVAGGSCRIMVTVDAEDGNAIPAETAANGLTVQLSCPGGSTSDTQILTYIPEGKQGPHGTFTFDTGTLTVAGLLHAFLWQYGLPQWQAFWGLGWRQVPKYPRC